MTESTINREIVKSLKAAFKNGWVYKIPDTPGPQMSPKPFDIVMINTVSSYMAGITHGDAFETKLLKSFKGVNINMLRENQKKGLEDFDHKQFRRAYVLWVYAFMTKERKRVKEMYVMEWEDLKKKKSWSYEELSHEDSPIECTKFKNGLWQF